jgi:hypothetical protein
LKLGWEKYRGEGQREDETSGKESGEIISGFINHFIAE